jgi:hypothetical protein
MECSAPMGDLTHLFSIFAYGIMNGILITILSYYSEGPSQVYTNLGYVPIDYGWNVGYVGNGMEKLVHTSHTIM